MSFFIKTLENLGLKKRRKPQILVLNDHKIFAQGLSRLLTTEYRNCLFTTSSAKTLSIMRTEPIDLFIQDILRSNDMNGFELYWFIKSDKKLCDIPILIVSMWATCEAPVYLTPITIEGRILQGIYRAVFENYKPEWLKMLKHIKDANVLYIEGYIDPMTGLEPDSDIERILRNQSLLTKEEKILRHKYLWSKVSEKPSDESSV